MTTTHPVAGTARLPDIVLWDALTLSRAIHAREVSCHEVMQAYLSHISIFNPRINALVSLREEETLLQEAVQYDRELALGQSRGWLHGVPQAIKDLSDAAGLRTTMGSPIFAHQVADTDSLMAARIKRDGAIVIGKTNTPEFGLGSHTFNEVFGATRNPWQPERSAGGSSGGAGAALALRLLPVADGSDMMGSLRNPAAWNNVFGLRPSFGRVPMGPPAENFGQQLSTGGPMARSVTDLARLLMTQAGADPRIPLCITEDPAMFGGSIEGSVKGLKIGWLGDWQGYLPIEEGILSMCEQALTIFHDMGCHVEHTVPSLDPSALWQCWLVLRQWSIAGSLGTFYSDPERRRQLKPEARWEIEQGLTLSAQQVYQANLIRSSWYACLLKLFDQYDYLALPAAQVFPFPVQERWPQEIAGRHLDTYHRWMEVVIPGSLSGCPVISLPIGFNDEGLPMGIQLIGRHRAEMAMLKLSHAYEQAADAWRRRLPGMLSDVAGI